MSPKIDQFFMGYSLAQQRTIEPLRAELRETEDSQRTHGDMPVFTQVHA